MSCRSHFELFCRMAWRKYEDSQSKPQDFLSKKKFNPTSRQGMKLETFQFFYATTFNFYLFLHSPR